MSEYTKKEALTIAGSLLGLWLARSNQKRETVYVMLGGFIGAVIANEIFKINQPKILS
jgi:hypothetical protein